MSSTNIRDFLGHMIGKKIVDISQHDEDEFEKTGQCYVMLLLEDGHYVKFYVNRYQGFHFSDKNGADEEMGTV